MELRGPLIAQPSTAEPLKSYDSFNFADNPEGKKKVRFNFDLRDTSEEVRDEMHSSGNRRKYSNFPQSLEAETDDSSWNRHDRTALADSPDEKNYEIRRSTYRRRGTKSC